VHENAANLCRYLPDDGWFRFSPRGIHGSAHVTRVLVWSDTLAGLVGRSGAIRREELRWAAAVHDVGRENDGVDAGHGARSASWVDRELRRYRPEIGDLDVDFVAELCRWHEMPDQQIERLSLELMILKDADALDRCRLGDLDPSRLRLPRAHSLIERAARLERRTCAYGQVSGADVLDVLGDVVGIP